HLHHSADGPQDAGVPCLHAQGEGGVLRQRIERRMADVRFGGRRHTASTLMVWPRMSIKISLRSKPTSRLETVIVPAGAAASKGMSRRILAIKSSAAGAAMGVISSALTSVP